MQCNDSWEAEIKNWAAEGKNAMLSMVQFEKRNVIDNLQWYTEVCQSVSWYEFRFKVWVIGNVCECKGVASVHCAVHISNYVKDSDGRRHHEWIVPGVVRAKNFISDSK